MTPEEQAEAGRILRDGDPAGTIRCICGARFQTVETLLVHAMLQTPEEAIGAAHAPHRLDRSDPHSEAAGAAFKAREARRAELEAEVGR